MVSEINLAMLTLNILLSIGVPIAFVIVATAKGWRVNTAFLAGAITFIISQIVIRVPLVMWFGTNLAQNSVWVYLAFTVLTAAVLEEGGRYAGMKIGLKESKRWIDGVAFGIGFAAGYNLLFTGVSHVSNLFTAIDINQMGAQTIIDNAGGDAITASIVNGLLETPWYKLLVLGVHDVAWLTLEVGLSLFVLYGIRRGLKKSILFVGIAALSHVLLEGVVTYLTEIAGLSSYKTEIYTLCISAVVLVLIILSKKLKWFEKQERTELVTE